MHSIPWIFLAIGVLNSPCALANKATTYTSDILTEDGHYNPKFQLPEGYNFCQADTFNPTTYQPIKGAKLKLVQAIVRHGVRLPVFSTPVTRDEWACTARLEQRYFADGSKRTAHPDSSQSGSRDSIPRDGVVAVPIVHSPSDNPYRNNVLGTCDEAQLTDVGMQQSRDLGKIFRDIYVDQLGFLPKILPKHTVDLTQLRASSSSYQVSQDQPLFVRTTTLQRTQNTAQSILDSLYPSDQQEPGAKVVMVAYPHKGDTMSPQRETCPRYGDAFFGTYQLEPWKEYLQSQQPLREQLEKVLETHGNTKFQGNFYRYMDVIMPRVCLGKSLTFSNGQSLSSEDVNQVVRNSVWENSFASRGSALRDDYNRLGVGFFIGDLKKRWDAVLTPTPRDSNINQETSNPQFELYSGHDKVISMIGGIWNQTDLLWPPYSSQLVFEFWEKDNGILVRIFYNGQVLRSDLCDFNGCPMEVFERIMLKDIPESEGECAPRTKSAEL
ncbi:hypothetical protein IWQ62_001218 [Dispira parvispora]|uniref:Phosphoglycerate mutase-like protein n=1 Tax=Dispira parvispora TaxID=1520584 RepID=A0A9W8ASU3_9FUNG|nr:hypothetical protein IWQ62_001218 [Dispira parvispora]